jgi:hypothetical protein
MTPLVVKGLDRPERTTLPHDAKFVLLGFRDIEGWPSHDDARSEATGHSLIVDLQPLKKQRP